MKRQVRYHNWNIIPLSELPTENIDPVNISPDIEGVGVPNTAEKLFRIVSDWIAEIYARTEKTGKEHGFYVDFYGNVIGIVQGTDNRLDWPDDLKFNRVIMIHTHPGLSRPAPSDSDLRAFSAMHENATQVLITVPESRLGGVYYTGIRDTESANELNRASENVASGPKLTVDYTMDVSNEVLSKENLRFQSPKDMLTLMREQTQQLEYLNDFIAEQEKNKDRSMIYSHKRLSRNDLKVE
jgi:hypothetical protein